MNKNQTFLLTQSQREAYSWLKKQNLNTDDATLIYWSKHYNANRLKDVVHFAQQRQASGQKIRNIGGWIQTILKKGIPVVNNQCLENRFYAQEFAKNMNWLELDICEKYVQDEITGGDISLIIPKESFEYALNSLYAKSMRYKGI